MSITFEKVLVLKNVSVFEKASEMALADLISVCEEKNFKEKEIILSEGQTNKFLYIIINGRVQLKQDDTVLSDLEARQFFGETTVLNPMPFPATVVAMERTAVLRIGSEQLYQMMALHPSLARGFLGELSKRLHQEQFKNK